MMTRDTHSRPSASSLPRPWTAFGCPHCGSLNVEPILRISGVPTQDGLLYDTREAAAAAPTGDIDLVFCSACGLVGNQAYEPGKVTYCDYDISTDSSPAFRKFLEGLASRLVETHALHDRRILEVGCGRGFLLNALCRLGHNEGLGIDPSRLSLSRAQRHASIRYVNDYYTEAHLAESFDLFVCRLLLDQLADQPAFLRLVHRALSLQPNAVAYFEVPNAARTFCDAILWNLVYEHRTWYFEESLRVLFEGLGFEVMSLAPCWHREYLGIEVRVAGSNAPTAGGESVPAGFERIRRCILHFCDEYHATIEDWHRRMDDFGARYERIALWGAGARAIGFLAAIQLNRPLAAVVDINPARQHKYLPCSALCILPPESLADLQPDLVLISNPAYADEIKTECAHMGLHSRFFEL